jgi:hypothetical protein
VVLLVMAGKMRLEEAVNVAAGMDSKGFALTCSWGNENVACVNYVSKLCSSATRKLTGLHIK